MTRLKDFLQRELSGHLLGKSYSLDVKTTLTLCNVAICYFSLFPILDLRAAFQFLDIT